MCFFQDYLLELLKWSVTSGDPISRLRDEYFLFCEAEHNIQGTYNDMLDISYRNRFCLLCLCMRNIYKKNINYLHIISMKLYTLQSSSANKPNKKTYNITLAAEKMLLPEETYSLSQMVLFRVVCLYTCIFW